MFFFSLVCLGFENLGFIIAWLLMCGVILIRYFRRVWVSGSRVCKKINTLLEQSIDEYKR